MSEKIEDGVNVPATPPPPPSGDKVAGLVERGVTVKIAAVGVPSPPLEGEKDTDGERVGSNERWEDRDANGD